MAIPNLKLYVLARVELQLGSLNASGAVGNYTKLQEGYVIVNTSRGLLHVPVPVITGNALKNWHARAMAEIYVDELGGSNIHSVHFVDMARISLKRVGLSVGDPKQAEELLVQGCAICDVHGYLAAERVSGGGSREEKEERGPPRRESLVKFSFAVPVEEEVKGAVEKHIQLKYPITHDRVSPIDEFMMVFHREYASAIFGWNAILDIASIGRSQLERDPSSRLWLGRPIVSDRDEIVRRAKAAILAFSALMSGHLGANASRALPIYGVTDLVVVLTSRSIPVPMPAFYESYADDLANLVGSQYGDSIIKVYSLKGGKASTKLGQLNKQEQFGTYYKLLHAVASDVEAILRSS